VMTASPNHSAECAVQSLLFKNKAFMSRDLMFTIFTSVLKVVNSRYRLAGWGNNKYVQNFDLHCNKSQET
jgi:hypothetical protein